MGNNKKNATLLMAIIGIAMMIVSWVLSSTLISMNQQGKNIEVSTEISTEVAEIETEEATEIEQELTKLNRVYEDLDISATTNNLSIADDGNYYLYQIYNNNNSVVNFISKVDNTDNYEIMYCYKYGSYTYIVFKYTEDVYSNAEEDIKSEDRIIE